MRHERRVKNYLISTVGGSLLSVVLGSPAPAVPIGGDLGRVLSRPSLVELALMTKKQQRLGRPQDPRGICTMRRQCKAGFVYILTKCLNRWSARKTRQRCWDRR